MLRSLKQLEGEKLGALDGEIGHVKGFYFDDQSWAVRYAVVDTGTWLPGKLVLLSPQAFGNIHRDGDRLLVNLTRQQIEDSPKTDSDKPVSRQYEEAYYRHYGWPSYWDGGGMGGISSVSALRDPYLRPRTANGRCVLRGDEDDPHLRCTQALTGYRIQTSAGPIGHVTDFMMDDKTWTIRHLLVETGHWFYGKEIVISPQEVQRISYEESTVLVTVTKESILAAPQYHLPPLGTAYYDSRNFD